MATFKTNPNALPVAQAQFTPEQVQPAAISVSPAQISLDTAVEPAFDPSGVADSLMQLAGVLDEKKKLAQRQMAEQQQALSFQRSMAKLAKTYTDYRASKEDALQSPTELRSKMFETYLNISTSPDFLSLKNEQINQLRNFSDLAVAAIGKEWVNVTEKGVTVFRQSPTGAMVGSDTYRTPEAKMADQLNAAAELMPEYAKYLDFAVKANLMDRQEVGLHLSRIEQIQKVAVGHKVQMATQELEDQIRGMTPVMKENLFTGVLADIQSKMMDSYLTMARTLATKPDANYDELAARAEADLSTWFQRSRTALDAAARYQQNFDKWAPRAEKVAATFARQIKAMDPKKLKSDAAKEEMIVAEAEYRKAMAELKKEIGVGTMFLVDNASGLAMNNYLYEVMRIKGFNPNYTNINNAIALAEGRWKLYNQTMQEQGLESLIEDPKEGSTKTLELLSVFNQELQFWAQGNPQASADMVGLQSFFDTLSVNPNVQAYGGPLWEKIQRTMRAVQQDPVMKQGWDSIREHGSLIPNYDKINAKLRKDRPDRPTLNVPSALAAPVPTPPSFDF